MTSIVFYFDGTACVGRYLETQHNSICSIECKRDYHCDGCEHAMHIPSVKGHTKHLFLKGTTIKRLDMFSEDIGQDVEIGIYRIFNEDAVLCRKVSFCTPHIRDIDLQLIEDTELRFKIDRGTPKKPVLVIYYEESTKGILHCCYSCFHYCDDRDPWCLKNKEPALPQGYCERFSYESKEKAEAAYELYGKKFNELFAESLKSNCAIDPEWERKMSMSSFKHKENKMNKICEDCEYQQPGCVYESCKLYIYKNKHEHDCPHIKPKYTFKQTDNFGTVTRECKDCGCVWESRVINLAQLFEENYV